MILGDVLRIVNSITYLSLLVVDHHVVRFDISVHNTFTMTEVEGFKQFESIVSYIIVDKFGV